VQPGFTNMREFILHITHAIMHNMFHHHNVHQSYLTYHVNISKQIKQVRPEDNNKTIAMHEPYF